MPSTAIPPAQFSLPRFGWHRQQLLQKECRRLWQCTPSVGSNDSPDIILAPKLLSQFVGLQNASRQAKTEVERLNLESDKKALAEASLDEIKLSPQFEQQLASAFCRSPENASIPGFFALRWRQVEPLLSLTGVLKICDQIGNHLKSQAPNPRDHHPINQVLYLDTPSSLHSHANPALGITYLPGQMMLSHGQIVLPAIADHSSYAKSIGQSDVGALFSQDTPFRGFNLKQEHWEGIKPFTLTPLRTRDMRRQTTTLFINDTPTHGVLHGAIAITPPPGPLGEKNPVYTATKSRLGYRWIHLPTRTSKNDNGHYEGRLIITKSYPTPIDRLCGNR